MEDRKCAFHMTNLMPAVIFVVCLTCDRGANTLGKPNRGDMCQAGGKAQVEFGSALEGKFHVSVICVRSGVKVISIGIVDIFINNAP